MGTKILILSDRIGNTNEELGRVLMRNFLYATARNPQLPSAVLLMNEGVRLACEDSASLDDLRLLVAAGVAVKACGTCLDYLDLTERLRVGEVGAMVASVEALLGADAVLTVT